ncbi:MAG TPA: SRPBCC domain-containing protein, partial [Gaiellaceae bacterium]|nr:SRPBCC domain-containing protein [Gaiellaceae bacterium]
RRARRAGGERMNETTVTKPNELEIRVERVFDAPREHVFSVWTNPELIPGWWGDGTVVEQMDVRPGGVWRFRTAYGAVEGEFLEVEPPARLVQTFQNHVQTLEFEDLGERTKLTQTMRFETTEERDTTMSYGVEEGAKGGFARVDAVLQRLLA